MDLTPYIAGAAAIQPYLPKLAYGAKKLYDWRQSNLARIYKKPATARNQVLPPYLLRGLSKKGPATIFNYHDVEVASQDFISDSMGITLLNGMARGTGRDERFGNKIWMDSLNLRGHLEYETMTGTEALVHDLAMILIVYDSQPNGALPTLSTEILADPVGTAHTRVDLSFRNLESTGRFKVLFHKGWILSENWNSPNGSVFIDLHVKVNKPTYFNTTTGVIAAITTGSLFIVTIGRFTAASGNAPHLDYITRLKFKP